MLFLSKNVLFELHAIEHEIDDDARHTDVAPDRKGPAGKGPMAGEVALQSPSQGKNGEDRNGRRQHGVREENR